MQWQRQLYMMPTDKLHIKFSIFQAVGLVSQKTSLLKHQKDIYWQKKKKKLTGRCMKWLFCTFVLKFCWLVNLHSPPTLENQHCIVVPKCLSKIYQLHKTKPEKVESRFWTIMLRKKEEEENWNSDIFRRLLVPGKKQNKTNKADTKCVTWISQVDHNLQLDPLCTSLSLGGFLLSSSITGSLFQL